MRDRLLDGEGNPIEARTIQSNYFSITKGGEAGLSCRVNDILGRFCAWRVGTKNGRRSIFRVY